MVSNRGYLLSIKKHYLSFIILLFSQDILCGFHKNLATSSRAFRCVNVADEYIQNCDLLSDSLKKAFLKNNTNDKYYFMYHLVLTVFFISQRPDPKEIDLVIKRLKSGKTSVSDFVDSAIEILSSAETSLIKNKFEIVKADLTDGDERESSFEVLQNIISNVGQRKNWSKNRIEEEQEQFKDKLLDFVKKIKKNDSKNLSLRLLREQIKGLSLECEEFQYQVNDDAKLIEELKAKNSEILKNIDLKLGASFFAGAILASIVSYVVLAEK